MPKISVIIPVYNVSEYLDKCLWSVTNQTFQDIEIITVNDGSTDDSLSVIEKYAENDDRIKIVNKKNGGTSAARKSGLEIATSDYIHHLDGDDYLELNCYELIYKKAIETEADIAIMKFWFDNPSISELKESESYWAEELNNIRFLNHIFETNTYNCVWQYIHKRSLYANGVAFLKEHNIGEDAYLTTQLIYFAKKIVTIETPLLHYISRPNSIVNQKFNYARGDQFLSLAKYVYEFIKDKPEYPLLKKSLCISYENYNNELFWRRYFKNGHERCKLSMKNFAEYPELKNKKEIYLLRKLIKMYAINPLLGRLFAQYYIIKRKIK